MEFVYPKDVNTHLEFLQNCNRVKDVVEAENALDMIVKIINNTINSEAHITNNVTRQTILNLAFRTCKKLTANHKLKADEAINVIVNKQLHGLNAAKQISYEVLFAYLQAYSDSKHFESASLLESCVKGIKQYQIQNYDNELIYIMLRTLNILVKRTSSSEPCLELSEIYFILQMNQQSIRTEILLYFSNCCKSLERAQHYFKIIVENYPWTNRHKYLLLSCILQNPHKLHIFLEKSNQNEKEFFEGLRLSLSYKRLHSPSQYLIKALSQQKSMGLLELAANILLTSTHKEITNFHANWFSRINEKDKLLNIIYEKLNFHDADDILLEQLTKQENPTEIYRFVLIFNMYCRQILNTSKLDFFRITTEMITNCYQYNLETQILIFKFIVDNLNCYALEDSLQFLTNFLLKHKDVENAQLRNNILGKMSTIINYTAKAFRKTLKQLGDATTNTLIDSILEFFNSLDKLFENEIKSKIYQPKIYTLKLLEILLKSLYQTNLEKNAKNCVISDNEMLGKFLIAKGVFNASKISEQLIGALNDPTGFDDAMDLIAELLQRMPNDICSTQIIESCKKYCESVDIDECSLSTRYALVALEMKSTNLENVLELQAHALNKLQAELIAFQKDTLNVCKTRCHIFSCINVINVTLCSQLVKYEKPKLYEMLDIFEFIVNLILELLISTSTMLVANEQTPAAASFQDMDESLEFLVTQSNFKADNNEECRKFLLKSFWLTLKACCDAATTLAINCLECDNLESDFEILERCFNVNVVVLTRCRHKGAIEAAGISIGKLTKHITKHSNKLPLINKMLCEALSHLFSSENLVSTTRRGAGYSIMFLHIVKNDEQNDRPILRYAMEEVFKKILKQGHSPTATKSQSLLPSPTTSNAKNCDRIEALCLHYLCVLAKDAELRDAIAQYRNEIILATMQKIDSADWTICNAALQLFGALVPKIVGQKQATEMAEIDETCHRQTDWEPAVVTFAEIANTMPKTYEYMLNYCMKHSNQSHSTRSIILFLGFLSKLEQLALDGFGNGNDESAATIVYNLRESMWFLLAHREEKVRRMAALVYVRAHEFSNELPQALLLASHLLFRVSNENFFEGLIFVIQFGILKFQNEALHTIETNSLENFLCEIRLILSTNFIIRNDFKFYTQTKLFELLLKIGFDKNSSVIGDLLKYLEKNVCETLFVADYKKLLKDFSELSTENKKSCV